VPKTLTTYFENYNKLLAREHLPSNLYVQPSVANIPDLGQTFIVLYTWNGPNTDEAKRWLSLISGLAPATHPGVKTESPLKFINEITAIIPGSVFGGSQTVSLTKYSPKAISIIAKHISIMPKDPCTALQIHSVRGPSCRPPFPDSVWRSREPHAMFEILGMASSEETYEASQAWALNFRKDLEEMEEVLEGTYISLTDEKNLSLEKVYGIHLNELKKLKETYDPNRVFKRVVPEL
jgi:hypothetical protein